MTSTINGEQIWQAMQREASFIDEVPHGAPRDCFQRLALRLPDVLGAQFEERVTLQSLMKAKLTVLRHVDQSGFMRELITAYPPEALGGQSVETIVEMTDAALQLVVPFFEGIISDAAAWLAEQEVTEEQVLRHPKGGKLSAEALVEYEAGTLTIGRLLVLQPSSIVKNTD